jgi:hypothetical protein
MSDDVTLPVEAVFDRLDGSEPSRQTVTLGTPGWLGHWDRCTIEGPEFLVAIRSLHAQWKVRHAS